MTEIRLPNRNATCGTGTIAPAIIPAHIILMGRGIRGGMNRNIAMLDGLRQFIADVMSPQAEGGDSDYRLAATALLVHVISLDGEPTQVERRKLHSLIESHFGLDRGTADRLIASATDVEGEAVDLYHFTSIIMRSLDEEGRKRIVEMMWELVYADGQVTEFEDNVVWRASDLLAVSSRDRMELKHAVARRRAGQMTDSVADR